MVLVKVHVQPPDGSMCSNNDYIALFAWLISHDWKYCWLICCEKKIFRWLKKYGLPLLQADSLYVLVASCWSFNFRLAHTGVEDLLTHQMILHPRPSMTRSTGHVPTRSPAVCLALLLLLMICGQGFVLLANANFRLRVQGLKFRRNFGRILRNSVISVVAQRKLRIFLIH